MVFFYIGYRHVASINMDAQGAAFHRLLTIARIMRDFGVSADAIREISR